MVTITKITFSTFMGPKTSFRFRKTTLLIVGLLAFLAGLGVARTKWQIDGLFVWVTFGALLITLWKIKPLAVLSIILFGLLLGWWRGSLYMHQMARYDGLYKRPVILVGVADSDALYGDKTQLAFDLSHVHVLEPMVTDLVGRISVKGLGENMIYKGDRVQVEGKLYATRGARQASMSFAQLRTLEDSNSPVDVIRRKFQAGMQSALPEPHASFGLGLLIGQRNTLPDDVTNQLAAVGLTHIVAVSGYNLTIIIWATRQLLKNRSKYQATIVSIALIVLFLLLTGLSASIVRAALVSTLSLIAWYYGRSVRPLLLILLVAATTAGFYPLYLWSDIGWYLSFLAFFGVLIIAPLVAKRLYSKHQPQFMSLLIIETLAAQLMTLPLIMYIFGDFSVVALVANILIVPLVPIAMLFSLVAGLGGMLVPQLSGWLAWLPRLLLTYMLDVIALLSRLPFALTHPQLDLSAMLVMYIILIFTTLVLWHKTKIRYATITDIKQTNEEFE